MCLHELIALKWTQPLSLLSYSPTKIGFVRGQFRCSIMCYSYSSVRTWSHIVSQVIRFLTSHKSLTETLVPGLSPSVFQSVVIIDATEHRFQRTTDKRLPDRGPAQTCKTTLYILKHSHLTQPANIASLQGKDNSRY